MIPTTTTTTVMTMKILIKIKLISKSSNLFFSFFKHKMNRRQPLFYLHKAKTKEDVEETLRVGEMVETREGIVQRNTIDQGEQERTA